MKDVKYYCDLCLKEIEYKSYNLHLKENEKLHPDLYIRLILDHLCGDCALKIRHLLYSSLLIKCNKCGRLFRMDHGYSIKENKYYCSKCK